MSNFEQTPERRADNFLSDVGGIHSMPEQKRFRGRHRVQTPRGGQCLSLSTSAAAFIFTACPLDLLRPRFHLQTTLGKQNPYHEIICTVA
jgi:hypothetical protein